MTLSTAFILVSMLERERVDQWIETEQKGWR